MVKKMRIKKKIKIAMLIAFILISLLSLVKTVELPTRFSDGYEKEWLNTTPIQLINNIFNIE